MSRECVQQLALRVSVVATTLARALRHHPDARLETQTLADVARTVHAVKPLVCWLDRYAHFCLINVPCNMFLLHPLSFYLCELGMMCYVIYP